MNSIYILWKRSVFKLTKEDYKLFLWNLASSHKAAHPINHGQFVCKIEDDISTWSISRITKELQTRYNTEFKDELTGGD